jgi:hypothetical protein
MTRFSVLTVHQVSIHEEESSGNQEGIVAQFQEFLAKNSISPVNLHVCRCTPTSYTGCFWIADAMKAEAWLKERGVTQK